MRLAWRCQEGSQLKEFCMPLSIESGDPGDAPLLAHWADVVSWKIPAWTKEKYLKASHSSKEDNKIWRAISTATSHEVYVLQRVDRTLLLSIYEQGRQVGQVNVHLWGELPQPQPAVVQRGCVPLEKAIAFIMPIVRMYCEGHVSGAVALKMLIHEKLQEEGLEKRRGVMKKPNSAAQDMANGEALKASKIGSKAGQAQGKRKAIETLSENIPIGIEETLEQITRDDWP